MGKKEDEKIILELLENKDLLHLTKRIIDTVKYSKLSKKGNFIANEYAEKVLEDFELVYDEFGRLWMYDEESGIWLENAEKDLDTILRARYLEEKYQKKYFVEEVIAQIKARVFGRGIFCEPDLNLIPFNDKIYDLNKDKLLSYSKKYFFTSKLPASIDIKVAKCPTIDRIFKELLGDDNCYVLYQIAAYCLYRAYPLQQAFFLVGDGRNGKSTFINILERFLGEENVSSVSLWGLEHNNFYISQLYGKLLNNCGELDENVFNNTSVLKQLTGGDLIVANKKFKEPFKFRNYAKILITTNKIPQTNDKSAGFYRRSRIIEFPYKFDYGQNAVAAIEKTIPSSEYDGFAVKCLQVLKDLKKEGFMLKGHKTIEQAAKEYEDASNPLSLYLKENVLKDSSGKISCTKLANLFNGYIEEKNLPIWSSIKISKEMKDKGYEMKTLSVKKDGQATTKKFWIGLKWK